MVAMPGSIEGKRKMKRTLRWVSVAACLIAGPAGALANPGLDPASAATVEVVEAVDPYNTAELRFVASPGESNRVRVVQRDADADHYALEIVDELSPLLPGSGCGGGTSPGTPVTCVLHKPHDDEYVCYSKMACSLVPGVGWKTSATFILGGVGSSLDASASDIDATVSAGPGDDKIATGGGEDRVDPGAGRDTVGTGSGRDLVNANAAADGPDSYDLGSGGDAATNLFEVAGAGDVIDYRERVERVEYTADALPNDGSPGEEDTVIEAEVIRAGAGNDRLVGGLATDVFFGGPGEDRLLGRGANDALHGEAGDDRLIGAAGSDELHDRGRPGSGDDFAASGKGNDYLELGPGRDRALGGGGSDAIILGEGADIGVGGPGDDDLRSGPGNDRLVGNGGADRLQGDGGRDAIVAAVVGGGLAVKPATARGHLDRQRDRVECGSEIDTASTNPWDKVAACERVFSLPPLPQRPGRDHRQSPNI